MEGVSTSQEHVVGGDGVRVMVWGDGVRVEDCRGMLYQKLLPANSSVCNTVTGVELCGPRGR